MVTCISTFLHRCFFAYAKTILHICAVANYHPITSYSYIYQTQSGTSPAGFAGLVFQLNTLGF